MSVKSVSNSLQPYYGPLSGINSQTAQAEGRTFAGAGTSRVTGTDTASATQDASVTGSEAADLWGFQASVKRDPRANGATAEGSSNGASEAPGGRSPPGIALYQRVSQYGSNDPSSASALLKSWNEILRGGQDSQTGVAAFAKALSQNETFGYESGVLDLTA